MRRLLFFFSMAVVCHSAYSGGYRAALQGQKALGMGHTGVSLGESAETIFFNPAGMSFIDPKLDIAGGVIFTKVRTRFQNTDTATSAQTNNSTGTPIGLYASYRHNEHWSYGLGVYTPYGNNVNWPRDWAGSHLVNYIDLKTIYIQPTVAYRFNESLSIGFGPALVIGNADFNRNINTSLQNASGERSNVTVEADDVRDVGYNLGVFFKPNDTWSFGISYRSKVTLEAESEKADFENIPVALQPIFPDTAFDAEFVLPAELTVGFTYRFNKKTLASFDINRTFWDAYEELKIEFDSPAPTSVNPRNYKNSNIYRVGLQYQMTPNMVTRVGYYYDETPVRDGYFAPETPRNAGRGFTLGLTYKVNKHWLVDASYLRLSFDEVDNSYDFAIDGGPFGGTYRSSVHAFGLGLTYRPY